LGQPVEIAHGKAPARELIEQVLVASAEKVNRALDVLAGGLPVRGSQPEGGDVVGGEEFAANLGVGHTGTSAGSAAMGQYPPDEDQTALTLYSRGSSGSLTSSSSIA
jgi:hypothetical protein